MSQKIKAAAFLTAAVLLCGCSPISEEYSESAATSVVINEKKNTPEESQEYGKYIYNRLSDKEKRYYDALVKAAENCEPKVFYEDEIDPDTAKKIFTAVYNEEPQLFWLDSLFFRPSGNSQVINYRFDKSEIPALREELEKTVGDILAPTKSMTPYEKTVFIHDYIVMNTKFSDDVTNTGAYGALCKGLCQCEGYAFSFKLLCTEAEIDCISVPGYTSEGIAHAWNMVKLDDIWYNVDCTWDDPILENGADDFIRRYYLLLPDSDILDITHFRSEEYFTYPLCYDSSRNYFQREGYFAYSASEGIELLEKAASESLAAGKHDAEVRFSTKSAYKTAAGRLFDMGEINSLARSACENAGISDPDPLSGMVRFCNDELFIIHITFKNDD